MVEVAVRITPRESAVVAVVAAAELHVLYIQAFFQTQALCTRTVALAVLATPQDKMVALERY